MVSLHALSIHFTSEKTERAHLSVPIYEPMKFCSLNWDSLLFHYVTASKKVSLTEGCICLYTLVLERSTMNIYVKLLVKRWDSCFSTSLAVIPAKIEEVTWPSFWEAFPFIWSFYVVHLYAKWRVLCFLFWLVTETAKVISDCYFGDKLTRSKLGGNLRDWITYNPILPITSKGDWHLLDELFFIYVVFPRLLRPFNYAFHFISGLTVNLYFFL